MPEGEKVVLQYGDRTVKGYADVDEIPSIEERMRSPHCFSDPIALKLGSDIVEHFPVADIKAIFLVKTLEGNALRNPLHFHTHRPVSKGLWVRIQFDDGELMEGIVANTAAHLLAPCVTLIPTDPGSNNRLVYVPKNRLTQFEVLGLRNPPQGRDSF